MKNILLVAVLAMIGVSSLAIPVKRTAITLTQGDGSTIQVRRVGDEFYHYWETMDGKPVRLNAEQMLEAIPDDRHQECLLHARERRASIDIQRAKRMSKVRTSAKTQRLASSAPGATSLYEGDHKGLMILVNFSDVKMQPENTREVFDDMYNKVGYNENGHIGSVHDYFYDQSYGRFNLTFDVVGPVTVSHASSYYGKNDYYGMDSNPEEMIIEAVNAVDDLVDFRDYDWDGDGEVDQVFVVYAGEAESSHEEIPDLIWPHEFHLSYTNRRQCLDGVYIDTYGCSSELDTGRRDGIGAACHEFSHCLGYKDLYDTDYNGGYGMDHHDLMDAGSYNGSPRSSRPIGFTAYERWLAGWLEPIELNEPTFVENMPCIADSAFAYIVYNDGNRNEFYLIENRQPDDRWYEYIWYVSARGYSYHGLLINHIDYDEDAWAENQVNTDVNRQRCTVIQADNGVFFDRGYTDLVRDLWPGGSHNTALTDVSTPAAKLYNTNLDGRKLMGKSIEEIVDADGVVSFTFMGGLYVPYLQPVNLSEDGAKAICQWAATEGASHYQVRVTAYDYNGFEGLEELVVEDMSGLTSGMDGSSDLSSSLSLYMQTPGWTGSKVYKGKAGAKLGSSSAAGYLLSPALTVEANQLTVSVRAKQYGVDNKNVTIALCRENGSVIASQKIEADDEVQSLMFDCEPGVYKVKISSTKRVYVSSIEVLGGVEPTGIATVYPNIQETRFEYVDLQPGYHYDFEVAACTASHTSLWSDKQTLAIESTAIETVVAPVDSVSQSFDLLGRPLNGVVSGVQVCNGKLILKK